LTDWKDYLKSHYARFLCNIPKTPFENAALDYSKVVSGQAKQLTRAQQIVQKSKIAKLGF